MNPAPFPPPPPPPARAHTGLAVASLVLGIFAFLLSFVVIGSILGLIGLVLGLVHISTKRGPAAMAWWGFALGLVSIVISLGMIPVYIKAYHKVKQTIATFKTELSMASAREWVGVPAPDFSLTTTDGKVIRLSELKGKRVVLNFWTTWWQPCVAELPHLIRLRRETPQEDIIIIGISSEDPETLGAFARKHGINYLVASATNLPAPFGDIKDFPTTYFIDRKGVIQMVSGATTDFDDLKTNAVSADFSGQTKTAPGTSTIEESDHQLVASEVWSKSIPGAQTFCTGDWDDDGQADILVVGGSRLHVLGADGNEKRAMTLPARFGAVAYGHHAKLGPRLAGFTSWEQKVSVVDTNGKVLWTYSSMLGVNGARWGDLDGDGNDELVIGMNGFGGLQALSPDGKPVWKAKLANVWGQAVVPAAPGRAAIVMATEAGGSVRVFDAQGAELRHFQPNGGYCTQLAAACMDTNAGAGTIQGLAVAQNNLVAFEPNETVLWSTPFTGGAAAMTVPIFACGDFDGDGLKEWAILDPGSPGKVWLVNSEGESVGTITNVLSGPIGFLPTSDGHGRLLTLSAGTLKAYSFSAATQK